MKTLTTGERLRKNKACSIVQCAPVYPINLNLPKNT